MKLFIYKRSLSRDLFLFTIIVIVAVLLFSIWFSWQSSKEQSNRILGDLESKALRIQSTLTDDIDYVSYQMEFLGNQIVAGESRGFRFYI